jgi:uncharacterized membrane protein YphA (DoxX/SURF4 family)
VDRASAIPNDAIPKDAARSVTTPATAGRAELALAIVRIVVGFWFLKSLWTKVGITMVGGILPLPGASGRWTSFMPTRVAEWSATNPFPWMRTFLDDVVIANAGLFAHLTVFGEIAVGVGLVFGLLTTSAAIGGLFLMTTYMLSSAGVPFNQQGLHVILIGCLAAIIVGRAGRALGFEAIGKR